MMFNNPLNIANVNQTPELCMEAIKLDPYCLKHIKIQTLEMCELAINTWSDSFKYVKFKDELATLAIGLNPHTFLYIENQTPEICKFAVDKSCDLIAYVKNQKELSKQALMKKGSLIRSIKEPTQELYKIAVKTYGPALEYIEDQTLDDCKYAVNYDAFSIKYVKNKTQELYELAIKNNPYVLGDIPQTKELCELAIGIDKFALECVKNPTLEQFRRMIDMDICLYNVNFTDDMINIIANEHAYLFGSIPNPTQEMCEIATRNYPPNCIYLKNPSKEVIKAGIKISPGIISQYDDPELCDYAMSINPRYYLDIKNPTANATHIYNSLKIEKSASIFNLLTNNSIQDRILMANPPKFRDIN